MLIHFSVKYLRYAMGRYQTQKFNRRIGVLKNKCGFTLVEMMVALAIASILAAAVYGLSTYMTRSFTAQHVTSDVQQRLRTGIDFVARDLRMAGFDPADTNEAGIIAANATSIRFTMDLDEDSLFNSAGEDITYNFTNRMLQRTDNNGGFGAETLVDNVETAQSGFIFFDGSTPPVQTAVADDIRTIVITIAVQMDAGRGDTVLRTMSARVNARNLSL